MPAPAPFPDSDSGRGFLTGFGDVVGVSDGFIARGVNPEDSCSLPDGCGEMWHSSDGLTWRNLGLRWAESSIVPVVLPWMGGALVTDGVGRFDFWTSQGHSELPMAEDVRAASKQPNEPYDNAAGTGPIRRSHGLRSTTRRSSSPGTASTGTSNRCPLRWRPTASVGGGRPWPWANALCWS